MNYDLERLIFSLLHFLLPACSSRGKKVLEGGITEHGGFAYDVQKSGQVETEF